MVSGNERVDHAAEARDLLLTEARGGTTTEKALLVMVAAQAAQVHATLALVEQQRVANKLAVALVDQLTGIARCISGPAVQLDPSIRIRDYLDADEWKGLGL